MCTQHVDITVLVLHLLHCNVNKTDPFVCLVAILLLVLLHSSNVAILGIQALQDLSFFACKAVNWSQN